MRALDRRPELISLVLTAALSAASGWATYRLVMWCVPTFANLGASLPAPTQFYIDVCFGPSVEGALALLAGLLLALTGAALRRWPRGELPGLIALFVAPVVPVVLLALGAVSLMLPLVSIVPAAK